MSEWRDQLIDAVQRESGTPEAILSAAEMRAWLSSGHKDTLPADDKENQNGEIA